MQFVLLGMISEDVRDSFRDAKQKFEDAMQRVLLNVSVSSRVEMIFYTPIIMREGLGPFPNKTSFSRRELALKVSVNIPHATWIHAAQQERLRCLAEGLVEGIRGDKRSVLNGEDLDRVRALVDGVCLSLTGKALTTNSLASQRTPIRRASQDEVQRLTLYKKEGERLLFHEAWKVVDVVVEHWGVVGHRGQLREHRIKSNAQVSVQAVLRSARQNAFEEIPEEEKIQLMVSHTVATNSSVAALERHDREDALNDALGWTGVGVCTGSSSDLQAVSFECAVVDVAVAKSVIERELIGWGIPPAELSFSTIDAET